MIMQDHHVAVVGELDPGEFAGRPLHGQRIGAARHRQHDVEGFAPWAHGVDAGAANFPLALDLVQGLLAAFDGAAIVFDVEATVLGDVAQVRSNRRHAAPAAGDLDHHLRCTPDRGLDPAADRSGSTARQVQARCVRRYLAVGRVEESIAPLDEDAVGGSLGHGRLLGCGEPNPHVHLSVKAASKQGKRLNPRKADLQRWRETFAERLREWGIDAEASPQITRGGNRRTERLWQRKARETGRIEAPRDGEPQTKKLTKARHDAAKAWCEIAKALAASDNVEDRRLARRVVDYARHLPGVRYKPPEQETQREFAQRERGRAPTREPIRSNNAMTQSQRNRPEPEIER